MNFFGKTRLSLLLKYMFLCTERVYNYKLIFPPNFNNDNKTFQLNRFKEN